MEKVLRMVRTDPLYGHIYDFFSVQYEYQNGAKTQCMCRQIDGCYGRIGEEVVGTKGKAIPEKGITEGPNKWKFEAGEKSVNPYEQEHKDLVESIRAGKPLNEETAALAGEAAVKDAKPMSGNAYKIQITRTAVKRAIMNAAGLKTV